VDGDSILSVVWIANKKTERIFNYQSSIFNYELRIINYEFLIIFSIADPHFHEDMFSIFNNPCFLSRHSRSRRRVAMAKHGGGNLMSFYHVYKRLAPHSFLL
jgi:hypothetical protein